MKFERRLKFAATGDHRRSEFQFKKFKFKGF